MDTGEKWRNHSDALLPSGDAAGRCGECQGGAGLQACICMQGRAALAAEVIRGCKLLRLSVILCARFWIHEDIMPKSNRITRRQFARGAAVAAAGAALLPHRLAAQSYPPPGSKLSLEAQSEVEAKLQNVLRKYGSRLSPAQKADVRRPLAPDQESLEP